MVECIAADTSRLNRIRLHPVAVKFSTFLLPLAILATSASGADDSRPDPRYPFRTDFANAHLPWYQPKPLEFPPHHSDRRIGGTLITVDFIHRTGQFRASKTGEVADFFMPPYASVHYLK